MLCSIFLVVSSTSMFFAVKKKIHQENENSACFSAEFECEDAFLINIMILSENCGGFIFFNEIIL